MRHICRCQLATIALLFLLIVCPPCPNNSACHSGAMHVHLWSSVAQAIPSGFALTFARQECWSAQEGFSRTHLFFIRQNLSVNPSSPANILPLASSEEREQDLPSSIICIHRGGGDLAAEEESPLPHEGRGLGGWRWYIFWRPRISEGGGCDGGGGRFHIIFFQKWRRT